MKLVERIKKGLIGLGAFLLTIPTKVFAVDYAAAAAMYGIPAPEPVKNNFINSVWNVCRIFIIPIALLIGIIIYLKKSKSSKKKKILVTIGIIAITAILYFVINKIIYELKNN